MCYIPVPTRTACFWVAWLAFVCWWYTSMRARLALLVCVPLALAAYRRWLAEPLRQRAERARELEAFFADGRNCSRALLELAQREKEQRAGT
jgi:hypothetical protein